MLRISMYAHSDLRKSGSNWGYAYGYNSFLHHFRNFEYNGEKLQVDLSSPKSKIQIHYGAPGNPSELFYPHQYKITVTHWESTLPDPTWIPYFDSVDETWAGNYFAADAYARGMVESKIIVAEHGVDEKVWKPYLRGKRDKIRFLHIDSGSPRKRADLVEKAFKNTFGDRKDVELTFKYSHYVKPKNQLTNWKDPVNMATSGEWDGNIRHIRETMSLEDLVLLHHFHDVLVFPSEGEGFGFIPLQALATGMPTISTGVWCSYEKFLLGNVIQSKMGISPIVESYQRFGKVILPNEESLSKLMLKVVGDIDNQSKIFFDQYQDVVNEYNWQYRCNSMVESLIDRVGIDMFSTYKGYLS